MKLRIRFTKHGTARFIGHLDTQRYFQKLNRSAAPVSGFQKGISAFKPVARGRLFQRIHTGKRCFLFLRRQGNSVLLRIIAQGDVRPERLNRSGNKIILPC